MKKDMKSGIAKMTGTNVELNKKALNMKRSWDEVAGLLDSAAKHTKKKTK